MSEALFCWRCGEELSGVILPMSRREECGACAADQHVCKLCKYYKEGIADSCTEDRAETVNDKERANFCDYFAPDGNAYEGGGAGPSTAQRELAALFGDELAPDEVASGAAQDNAEATSSSAAGSSADRAMSELEKLFGKEDDQ